MSEAEARAWARVVISLLHMNTKNLRVGLDLGDRRHHACVLDEGSEILAAEVTVNTREVLTAF